MNEPSPFTDSSTDPRLVGGKLPGSLNTLTILTLIACGLIFIFSIVGFFTAESGYRQQEEMLASGKLDQMPFMKNFINEESVAALKLSAENKVPVLVISLVATALCTVGALQMRKLKKQGYYIWLIGEVFPLVGTFLFMGGASALSGTTIFFLLIEVIFVILYARQLKYMS